MSRGFDRLSWCYAGLERMVFGGRLQACRTASLHALRDPRRVLILGEGDGRFVVELRRRCPAARIVVVDASAKMIRRARLRLLASGGATDVAFVVADARFVDLDADPFDAVVANFFFDCFEPSAQAGLLDRVERWLAPEGLLVLGEFVPAPTRAGRLWRRLLSPAMHVFFRAVAGITARRLQDIPAALRVRGFVAVTVAESLGGFLHSSAWRRGGGAGEKGLLQAR